MGCSGSYCAAADLTLLEQNLLFFARPKPCRGSVQPAPALRATREKFCQEEK